MDDEDQRGPGTVERSPPESVFQLLADNTRISIVRALAETPNERVTFSDLRDRVGTRDSGKFNYHLEKLVGSFVRKSTGTDDQGGYELTHAGKQVVGAMYAGTYTASATVEAFTIDAHCPICGGDIVVEYDDEVASMDCSDCDEWHNRFPFPPGSLDQFDRDELPLAFDRWMRNVLGGIVAGFCPTCSGRMSGSLVLDEDPGEYTGRMPAHAEFVCERCGSLGDTSAATPALLHPGVQGFLFDHGFDLASEPDWRVFEAVDLPEAVVLSEDPLRVEVRISHDGETVATVLDEEASVRSVERRVSGE